MQQHPNFLSEIILPEKFAGNVAHISWDHFMMFLAPLEGNTEVACRRLCYEYGANLTITEMVRVKSAIHKNKSTLSRLNFDDETPTIVQLLVSQELEIAKFLRHFIPPKNFYGFNINASCPSKDIIQDGLGCALVKRSAKIQKMIDTIREFSYPVSLKIRLGLNEDEKQQKVYLRTIENTTPDFFIVHARHGTQRYLAPADFSIYPECVATGKKIIANGDIHTPKQIAELQQMGVAGAMFGRSAIANPSIFIRLKKGISRLSNSEKTLTPIPHSPKIRPREYDCSLASIEKRYRELAQLYKTPETYQKNVLRRLGKPPWMFDRSALR